MDINEQINYRWPFGWDSENMSPEIPVVNRLLKAMIEKNVDEMNRLFSAGATIKGIDKGTFQRTLYHLLEDYSVIKCLIDHGFIGAYGEYEDYQKCLEPAAYFWGLPIRAWYIGRYDVFELLAQNGFGELGLCSSGKGYRGEELIIKKNDVKAVKILMENGYPRTEFLCYENTYPQSEVIRFLQKNPVIHRKTIMLDSWKFKEIPRPKLEKAGFFNRKSIEQKNAILMEDYEDRVLAQKKLKESLGIEKYNSIIDENQKIDEMMKEIWNDVLDNPLS